MSKRYDWDTVNLEIVSFEPFNTDKYSGIVIAWQSDIGWGEYTIYRGQEDGKWYADTETMDYGDDKDFGRKLFEVFMDKVIIE